ncbi:MAG: hypothetical protein IPP90_01950 [Gemmatimonadaceae bacterium]|nr:hypothetical protein [Gemmatimonadaceae bacterium]
MRGRFASNIAWLLLVVGTRAGGQSSGARVSFELGAMGVGALTHAAPGVFGTSATEGYLTQPNVMVGAHRGPIALTGTINLEGYTLRRGELNAGIYGEGYVDRRHPHTLVHEAMLSVTSPTRRGVRASLAAGKGFTPFGTDDPMMRPLVKYPVNHHHAQIIERVQTIGAIAIGDSARGVAVEHAFFNGDEPVGPFIGPQWRRFGDSRTSRLTVVPTRDVELQASRAFVRSPGITQGGAFDHTQTSVSLRFDRTGGGQAMAGHAMNGRRRYLLAEFARTDEGFGAERVFRFNSVLVEGLLERGGWGLAARAERTDRPENERLLDPFRVANGHIDFQIIGITQWSLGTVHLDAPSVRLRRLADTQVAPYVEVSRARPVALRTPAVFEPQAFYGAGTLWSVTAGVRLHVGTMRRRMGRYGVLASPP